MTYRCIGNLSSSSIRQDLNKPTVWPGYPKHFILKWEHMGNLCNYSKNRKSKFTRMVHKLHLVFITDRVMMLVSYLVLFYFPQCGLLPVWSFAIYCIATFTGEQEWSLNYLQPATQYISNKTINQWRSIWSSSTTKTHYSFSLSPSPFPSVIDSLTHTHAHTHAQRPMSGPEGVVTWH